MNSSSQSSSLVILDSSAYEWNEEFIFGQPQAYDSQNIPYVVNKSAIMSNHVPTTADELIDCFLSIMGHRDAQHGPSTYLDLDLRALCAGCNMKTVEDGREDNVRKPVALLDDRSRWANQRLSQSGYKRANAGLLSASQLLIELQKKRYKDHRHPDAERRLLYMTNPDCWAFMVLMFTASPQQAQFLIEFFYKYLGSKASLGIHLPVRGVLSFALEFHLQFYVWREEDTLRQDPRRKKNKPLRRSFQLNCIDEEDPEMVSQVCIYEAQVSCLVSGLDHYSWVAYMFIDTYYQEDSSSESVEYYDSQEDPKTDPLAAGTIDADMPIWAPREYFLFVYEIRLKQVKHALQNLVSRLWLKLKPYIQDPMTLAPCPTDHSISPAQKNKIQQMLSEASRLLRQIIQSICKAVEVWDRFSSRDAAYLSDILRPRPGRPDPMPPFRIVVRIEEHVAGLRDLQRLAEEQQQELGAGFAREAGGTFRGRQEVGDFPSGRATASTGNGARHGTQRDHCLATTGSGRVVRAPHVNIPFEDSQSNPFLPG